MTPVPTATPTTSAPTTTPTTSAPTITPDPTVAPTTALPTEMPSTEVPTQATASPTVFTVQRTLLFTLEIDLSEFLQNRNTTQSDLSELESLTSAYLRDHFFGTISSSDVLLEDFSTDVMSHIDRPDSSIVLVTFRSTAFFDAESPSFPTLRELFGELENAFSGQELDGYLGMVQALPESNMFSSTTQITFVDLGSNGATAVWATVVVLAAFLAATFTYYRRRHGRREDSDKFLNDIVEMEAPTENFSSVGDGGGDNNEDSDDDNRVSEFSSFRDNNYLREDDDDDDESEESDDGFTNHTSRILFFESQDTANYHAGRALFRGA
jgi:hypothetical protein